MKWLLFCSVLIASSPSAFTFEFAQGVIVDGAHAVAYVMNPEGGIDAVALSGGAVLATTMLGEKPLLLQDDTLLAQAAGKDGVLNLVSLRAKDLEPAFMVDVPLPSGVQASVSDRLGSSFYASARMDDDVVLVHWRSVQRTIGAVPTRELGHVSTGFARIDPRNLRLIASGEGEPSTPGNAEEEIIGSNAAPRCASSDVVAAIQYDRDKVALRRWNKAGESLPEIMFDGELTFQNFSRDCRLLLLSKAANGWTWHIYAVASGRLLTKIQSSLPSAEFFVWGNSLIYEAPAVGKLISGRFTIVLQHRLQAIDFTGKELWARPIRETTYGGPYPANQPNLVPRQGE
jgi:hypothetical protein